MQSNTWAEGYESLGNVLQRAHNQAAHGKGAQRHSQGQSFDSQPMQQLISLYGVGFALGQAGKKAQESQRMDKDAAVRELLGAINYLAGAVIALEGDAIKEQNAATSDWRATYLGVKKFKYGGIVEAKPDADGWIEWRGGSCPVLPEARVTVRHREVENMLAQVAGSFRWSHVGSKYDIVAYRLVK